MSPCVGKIQSIFYSNKRRIGFYEHYQRTGFRYYDFQPCNCKSELRLSAGKLGRTAYL